MDQKLGPGKKIGLVAHDNKKRDLLDWVEFNHRLLAGHDLVATGTTGTLLEEVVGTGNGSCEADRWGVTSSWER